MPMEYQQKERVPEHCMFPRVDGDKFCKLCSLMPTLIMPSNHRRRGRRLVDGMYVDKHCGNVAYATLLLLIRWQRMRTHNI